MSVNKAILVGNVGRDPEIRRTQDGRPIANFSLATAERWRDKNTGERKEKTEWHRIVVFNDGLCKVVEQYVKKGSKLYVEGQIQTRKWQDKDGVEKFSTEIVVPAFGGTIALLGDGKQQETDKPQEETIENGRREPLKHQMDDEIPF